MTTTFDSNIFIDALCDLCEIAMIPVRLLPGIGLLLALGVLVVAAGVGGWEGWLQP